MILPSCIILLLGCFGTMPASASTASKAFAILTSAPFHVLQVAQKRWSDANAMATLEQEVEDWNAQFVAAARDEAQACTRRRLICQPLEEEIFDPPMGSFSHRHVQTGDKISLPKIFWDAVKLNNAEVPWLYQVSRIDGVTGERVHFNISQNGNVTEIDEPLVYEALDKVVGGPLDFRAPPNYVFLPWWMMRALGLQPRDVVDVQLIKTVPAGQFAKLRPHSSDFAKITNPQAVMETELRHYSALVKGATIALDYNKKRYWFDVVELVGGPRGEKHAMVKAQDCNIRTEFLTAKDVLKKRKAQKEAKEKDMN